MSEPGFEPEVPGNRVIEALRAATRSRHARLAAIPAMARLFDASYTLPEYRAHLARLLGLFEPLERAAGEAAAAFPDRAVPVEALRRSRALREDLSIMGATSSALDGLERCAHLPAISPAGLRGYAYVILGSMLGGKIIVKRLTQVLGPEASVRFYGAGDGASDPVWAGFCEDLETNGKDDLEEICATASGIFDSYAAWLSEPEKRRDDAR
jgi:heme oxygenase